MRILLAFIFLFSQTTWGQVSNKTAEFNYVWGADYYTNWVLNPGANLNLSNTTTSNATLTRDTTTKLNNVASFNLDTSATSGYAEFTLGTVVAPATAGNCQFKGVYLGNASLLSAQVLDGSSNVLASAALQNSSTNWQTFSVYYPCAASGSRKVRITQTTAGTTAAINLGKLYYGQQTDVGAGVPNNTFSAQISATGVVTNENEDFINGNCVVTASNGTCTLNTGKFTVAPTCTVTPLMDATLGTRAGFIMSTSTTTVVYSNSISGVGNMTAASMILCTRSSTDWIQPTITAPNWDTDWQDLPSVAAGTLVTSTGTSPTFGTIAVNKAQWRRVGGNAEFRWTFRQTTAGTAGSNTYLWNIPASIGTIDTTKVSVNTSGSLSQVDGGVGYFNFTDGTFVGNGSVGVYSTSQLKITNMTWTSSASGYTVGAWAASGATSFANTNLNIVMLASVPIVGWTKTLSAPMLVGSVTSNATGALRIESASFNCTGASSLNSQTSNAFASIGNVSAGACTLSFTSGAFSSAPYCTMNVVSSSVGVMGNIATAITTSSVVTQCVTTAAGCANYSGYITCIGPR